MVALRGLVPGLRVAVALGLLEDVEALAQAAEGGSRRGFEQQQVLVQAGHGAFGGQRIDGLGQALLLALSLGHHLPENSEHRNQHRREAVPLPRQSSLLLMTPSLSDEI